MYVLIKIKILFEFKLHFYALNTKSPIMLSDRSLLHIVKYQELCEFKSSKNDRCAVLLYIRF